MPSAREATKDFELASPLSVGAWDGGWPETLGEFELLVDAFQDRLVRHAFHRLGNLDDAEDVVQEVLLRVYAEGLRGKTVTQVGAYLHRATSNLCTDVLRRRKHGGVSLEHAEALEMPTTHPNGPQAAIAAEELHRIELLLRRIPRRQADVVRLRVLDELPLNEIGNVVGCPLATVKSRLRYGLDKLRKIVTQEWEESQ